MVEVKATLYRNVRSSTRCPPAVKGTETLGSLQQLEENLRVYVLAVAHVWPGCCSSISAVRLELPSSLVGAPGASVLNGKLQQPLAVRCRPDKLVLTDKAQQLWSTTELRNRNANMQP